MNRSNPHQSDNASVSGKRSRVIKIIDIYQAAAYEHPDRDTDIESFRAIADYVESEILNARIAAYEDCGSKGGESETVRQYAKSRADILKSQQQIESLQND